MGLMRLSNIANYLTLERDLGAAVQFVALNACESGLPCRFYVSRLNSDLTLHHIASFGFRSVVKMPIAALIHKYLF